MFVFLISFIFVFSNDSCWEQFELKPKRFKFRLQEITLLNFWFMSSSL